MEILKESMNRRLKNQIKNTSHNEEYEQYLNTRLKIKIKNTSHKEK